jgi:Txe/YoeB family toxin of Txe-Axe toxin-antitoxin module
MIEKGMCSGREFLKLTDQGFDKFPLKISKGKEIMQKFADIIEKIELDPYFLTKKLNNSAH